MIDLLATILSLVVLVTVAYGLGHEDGRDAEFAERWDSFE